MRRILSTAGVLTALGLAFWAWPAEGGDGGRYLIRAIFDNAGFVVQGEEVRVAGATVGVVESVDVTRPGETVSWRDGGEAIPGKAAIVMEITDGGFKDFRSDASCLVRPQSLIGERFIDCLPTQPRAAGSPPPPELRLIPDGQPGEGQRLLPLENNGKAVDLDLVQNVMRYPYRERFRIIFSELGAGLAARGDDLRGVIKRANPGLRETNRVLRILAEQRDSLQTLAENGNKVMAPLARERASLVGFLANAAESAQATAELRPELEEGIRKLPASLVQVRKTMDRLTQVGKQGAPLMENFKKVAPYLNVATKKLGPFAQAGIPALQSLGAAGDLVGPDMAATYANGFFGDLQDLGDNLGTPPDPGNQYSVSTATEIEKTFGTFAQTSGIEYLTDALYNLSGTVNGYDQYGHMLRGNVLITGCPDYRGTPLSGCIANWGGRTSTSAQAPLSTYRASPPDGVARIATPPEKVEDLPEIDSSAPEGGQTTPGPDAGTVDPGPGAGIDGTGSGPPAGSESRMTPKQRAALERNRAAMNRAEILLRYLLGAGA